MFSSLEKQIPDMFTDRAGNNVCLRRAGKRKRQFFCVTIESLPFTEEPSQTFECALAHI